MARKTRKTIPASKKLATRARKRTSRRSTVDRLANAGRFQETWNRVGQVITKMRKDGVSLATAARDIRISPSTVKRWGKSALRKNKRGRYVASKTDRLLRVLQIPTSQGMKEIAVSNSRDASRIAKHAVAVDKYLETGDASALEKFRGVQISDATGTKHLLLTDLNELNRLGSAGALGFESLYAKST